jgi:hypothetical protein
MNKEIRKWILYEKPDAVAMTIFIHPGNASYYVLWDNKDYLQYIINAYYHTMLSFHKNVYIIHNVPIHVISDVFFKSIDLYHESIPLRSVSNDFVTKLINKQFIMFE